VRNKDSLNVNLMLLWCFSQGYGGFVNGIAESLLHGDPEGASGKLER